MNYETAYKYVEAWATFDHDDIREIYQDCRRDGKNFYGKLGSLYFLYSEQDGVLHSWGFVSHGAGPFLTNRQEIKTTLDQIARQKTEETAGGAFDILILPTNENSYPNLGLEPSLYLRLDLLEGGLSSEQMVKKLNALSTAAYLWNRDKMQTVLDDYWKKHPSDPGAAQQSAKRRRENSDIVENWLKKASLDELYSMLPEYFMSKGVPRPSVNEAVQRYRDGFKTVTEDQTKASLIGTFQRWRFLSIYLLEHGQIKL